jgi:hypothetical protein
MARPHCARQFVARTDAGREHDHVGLQVAAVGELHAVRAAIRRRRSQRVLAACARSRPVLRSCCAARGRRRRRPAPPSGAARTRPRGFPAHVAQRLGAFQAQQAAADHHAALPRRRIRAWLPGLRWCGRRSSRRARGPAPAARRATSRWRAPACRRPALRRRPVVTVLARSIAHGLRVQRSTMPRARRSPARPATGRRPSCRRRIRTGARGRRPDAALRTAP